MKLTLKREARFARARRGHPWVFANEVREPPGPEADGSALPLEDAGGRPLGMGIVNTRSQILWRRYSAAADAWDAAFWRRALGAALARREEEPFRRLVWSEADDLPGLVVDQFDDVLVVQALTLAVDACLPQLLDLLDELLRPRDIVVRNDAPARRMEGLELHAFTRSGAPVGPFWAELHGVAYQLDPLRAQKTGFYLDQRREHAAVGALAAGRRVLDAFCNQGAFALNCARAGAAAVVAIDSSAEALRLARDNAARNGAAVDFRCENVFDFFTRNRDERFDLVILDPPSFAPNRRSLPGAAKGYKELQLRALKCLNPGGILATYCCSHHVSREFFRGLVADAAADARRRVQILRETGQPPDHPVLLDFPESEYLKGLVLLAR